MELVARPVEVGRDEVGEPLPVLRGVHLGVDEVRLLGDAVRARWSPPGSRPTASASANGHRRELRVRAHRADQHRLAHVVAPGRLDHVRAHEEVGGVERRRLGLVVADAADPGGEVDDQVRLVLAATAASACRRIGEVELGLAGRHDVGPGSPQAPHHHPAEEARASGDEDAPAGPEVAHDDHATGGQRGASMGGVRVAYTLEQCWHARARRHRGRRARRWPRELVERPERRPGRRRRAAPPPAAGAVRAADPGAAAARSRAPRCTRRGGASAGHRSSGRPVRSTSSTPRRSSSRPGGAPLVVTRARPRLPATTRVASPATASSAFTAGLEPHPRARRPGAVLVAGDAGRRRRRRARPATGSGSSRWASTRSSDRGRGRGRGAAPARPADRPYLLFVGTLEPRKNLARLLEAYRSARPRRSQTGRGRARRLGRRRPPTGR